MKFSILLYLSIVFVLLMANKPVHAEGKPMNVLKNKPIFEVKLSAFNVSHIIDVNGSTIQLDYSDNGQVSTTFPVNHYMRSGENKLTIHMLPPSQGAEFNPNSYVEVELWVHSKGNEESKVRLTSLRFDAGFPFESLSKNSSPSGQIDSKYGSLNEKGEVRAFDVTTEKIAVYEGAISLTRKLDIPNALPLWAYFDSDDIPDVDTMSDEEYYNFMDTLLIEYMKVQNALASKTIDEIMPMFAERNRELDAAFYREPGTMEKELRESLVNAANDPDLELLDLKADYVGFTVERNQKLTSLTRNGSKPAITLNFKSGFGSQRYNLIFRRENGKWILTR